MPLLKFEIGDLTHRSSGSPSAAAEFKLQGHPHLSSKTNPLRISEEIR
jgi:hypothetical protein